MEGRPVQKRQHRAGAQQQLVLKAAALSLTGHGIERLEQS
jgi:hypothetical protein